MESWIKKGLIFKPDKNSSWMVSHGQLPVADLIYEDIYRIYFATRNEDQRSHIGYIEIDINYPENIIAISENPVIAPGSIGSFDEHGVFPSSIVNHNGKKYMYYIGWNQGVEAPLFYANIGLAISEDNGLTFKKYSQAPIMSRSEYDPCLVTSPHVYIENGLWRMTYVSGIKWTRENGKLKSYYHIKYAESADGIHWERTGIVSVDFKSTLESNIARSAVISEGGVYKMWYSYVSPPNLYRMGYAESIDGKIFTRKDELVNIDVTPNAFDSDMMCYPSIVVHDRKKIMFYNGNYYGKEGIGMAVVE